MDDNITNMNINIVDASCGKGKTTSIINKINTDKGNNKYLYITPLLSEVERIIKECPSKNFKQPIENKTTKLEDIVSLFENGENIVSTHALFRKFNDNILDLASFNNYILIMDEVADLVEDLAISKNDLRIILQEYAEPDENGTLIWKEPGYEGKFQEYKDMIEMNSVTVHKIGNNEVVALLWFFPIKIFEAFQEIYILTYMFDGQLQKYYYEYYGIGFNYLYVKDMQITSEVQKYDDSKIKNLISICEVNKLNKIGDTMTALSSSWFDRNQNTIIMNQLKNNLYNYFRNITKTNVKENLWTTFKEYENSLKGKGYGSSFAPLNVRATNDYMQRTSIAYLPNRFLRPMIKNFFLKHDIKVDEDMFALSEMIQFIFRGAIRKGEPISVYVPSKRMRGLLKKWIEEQ